MNSKVDLHVSNEVRHAFGNENVNRLQSGEQLPQLAECLVCGKAIRLREEPWELNTLMTVPHVAITLFTHRRCGLSRCYTMHEMNTIAQSRPSEVIPEESGGIGGL